MLLWLCIFGKDAFFPEMSFQDFSTIKILVSCEAYLKPTFSVFDDLNLTLYFLLNPALYPTL